MSNIFRPLQNALSHDSVLRSVLGEEKDVVGALRNLARQKSEAAKAVAEWGVRDGDDLGVIVRFTTLDPPRD